MPANLSAEEKTEMNDKA
ncbi:hypothetical protein A2U01_0064419, partial [Trifolium medium]|nr:hypothetical protein [Trifolium medium]